MGNKLFNIYILVVLISTSTITFAYGYINKYQQLLSKYVEEGAIDGVSLTVVNYDAWILDPLHEEAVWELQQVDPSLLEGQDAMAFWINAYNLLTVDLIIKTQERESIRNQGSLFKNVWKSHKWEINGQSYTLDEIEHKILRPMGDPRIHMAINCASVSCPDLYIEPYKADKLNEQLDKQTLVFLLNSQKGVQITEQGITISHIFKWFAEDFGTKADIKEFIKKYNTNVINDNIVDYLDYNWSLNEKS